MENVDDKKLSFPQRNWFLLCVIVAILSPLLVHSIQTLANKQRYEQAIHQKPVQGGDGGTDTSYKVAAPPQHN